MLACGISATLVVCAGRKTRLYHPPSISFKEVNEHGNKKVKTQET